MNTNPAPARAPSGSAAGRRLLKRGDAAPPIIAESILATGVTVPDTGGLLTHIQFLRFANCPICNLHLQAYIRRIADIRAAGVREVVLFHSAPKHPAGRHAAFPFDVIADPGRRFFNQYRIGKSLFAVVQPKAWSNLIAGYQLRPSGMPDSSTLGLPADFLISPSGRIIDCHYGTHAADQWPLDTMLQIAAESRK